MNDTDLLRQFRGDMGENPLGTRVGLKAAGGHIVELYNDVFGNRRRIENGQPPLAVVQVYEYVPDSDHFRDWRQVGLFRETEGEVSDTYRALHDGDDVAAFIEEHGGDE